MVLILFTCVSELQSLVQNSRKAGITSAMACSTLNNEELVITLWLFAWPYIYNVGPPLIMFIKHYFLFPPAEESRV